MTKLSKNFLLSIAQEWEQGYHQLNKEKKLSIAQKFWREVHSDTEEGKALLHEVGKIILTKLLPSQVKSEGFGISNIIVNVKEVHGDKPVTAPRTENRLEGHSEI